MIEVINSADDLARQNWDVLVPTMGALHAGHESLIKLAKSRGDQVIVSIFVNPLQFENKADLLNYPKTIDSEFLKLPHPLAQSRSFVLSPWLVIDPDGEIPGVGAIKTLLASIASSS